MIAGPDGWGTAAFLDAVQTASHGDRIVRLGYVDDSARADLLAGAHVLAYPSLDEGFGHPPLEAMRAGVPVVAARAGALPEVLGDAALLAAPSSVPALADALHADERRRRDAALTRRGRSRARRVLHVGASDRRARRVVPTARAGAADASDDLALEPAEQRRDRARVVAQLVTRAADHEELTPLAGGGLQLARFVDRHRGIGRPDQHEQRPRRDPPRGREPRRPR